MSPFARALLALALVAGLGACQSDDSPIMKPGQDCMACHASGQEASDLAWTLAGTVYAAPDADASAGRKNVTVHVTDSTGRSIDLESNSAGNFYSAEERTPPFTIELRADGQVKAMPEPAEHGACNACHGIPPGDPDAPGRVFIP